MSKKSTVAALVGGACIGAAAGVLLAPKSGKETREDLMRLLNDFSKKVKELNAADIKKYVDKSMKKIKKELDDLSLEKVADIAKKRAKDIQKNIDKLVAYVKEKGTPVLEDAVEQIRLKAIDVCEGTIKKLENSKK